MSTIAQEINAITTAQGGTAQGQTIAEAVNALADTLAGEDVAGGRTISDAISKLAPYIGTGGGGGGITDGVYTDIAKTSRSVPQVGNTVHAYTISSLQALWTAFPDEDGAERVASSGTYLTGGRSGLVAQSSGPITVIGAYEVDTDYDDDAEADVYTEVTDLSFNADAGTYTYDGKTYRIRVIPSVDSPGITSWFCYEMAPVRKRLVFVDRDNA